MKECKNCKELKGLNNFYKDRTRKDGYSRFCKVCTRIFYRERRIRNPETFKRKAKTYYENHKAEKIESVRVYEKKYPERRTARNIVRSALIKGILISEKCLCGAKAEAHHPDYSKPLEVVWLCKRHHREAHGLTL